MRGINVGGARKVPMAALRALCDEIGLVRPETYIQSGNLIIDTDRDAEAVRTLLEAALAERFGFPVDVIVCAARDWERYVAANPFAGDAESVPAMIHLYVCRDAPLADAAATLAQRAKGGERIRWADATRRNARPPFYLESRGSKGADRPPCLSLSLTSAAPPAPPQHSTRSSEYPYPAGSAHPPR